MRFHCVDDFAPDSTLALLARACEARGVEFVRVDASSFAYDEDRRARPGELLYRPATSIAAMRVEMFLMNEGVATFYRQPERVFFQSLTSPLLHHRAGVPIPPTVFSLTRERERLKEHVARLGGFPLVLKVLGGEGGLGVMQVDSFPGLFSLVDLALAQGSQPLLCGLVPDATHWRVVVVGDAAVAHYRNYTAPDDFRSHAGALPEDVNCDLPAGAAEVAVRAVETLGFEFGGVDVLHAPDGRVYVLEANFPCYHPHAEEVGGVDVSGAMLDYLLAKARRLTGV